MPHLVLLGDSIFDNKTYVPDRQAVIDHLRGMIGAEWEASLLAVDGNSTIDVPGQLAQVPDDATHLVLSIGGNDAIFASDVMNEASQSVGQSLLRVKQISDGFEKSYLAMLKRVMALNKPLAICTIYYPRFDDNNYQQISMAGLALFNDVIIRAGAANRLPMIDLRLVCSEREDYANEIEPSAAGGKKIAAAVWRAVSGHDFSGVSTVTTGDSA